MSERIEILDTTLRDGAQADGVSFSVEDMLGIVQALDDFGIPLIEAGHPALSPKDADFFKAARRKTFQTVRLAAFGATRRKELTAESDPQVQGFLASGAPVASVFGKSWTLHTETVLKCTPSENLDMILDTVSFLTAQGMEVIFDAEHFFDGYRADPGYALETLRAAARGGARTLCLCDTNGGTWPREISDVTGHVVRMFSLPVGIHCHNDSGQAAASTLMAVQAGATHVQGTINGIGERCGNANLSTVLGALASQAGKPVVPDLSRLTYTARRVAEIANVSIAKGAPYVGDSAFAHKAGMHVDGVLKEPAAFEHIDPMAVGNHRRLIVSEMAGRSAVLALVRQFEPSVPSDSPLITAMRDVLKERESAGYQYEGAQASFALLWRRLSKTYKPSFRLHHFKTIGEHLDDGAAMAVIKISVDDVTEVSAAEGNGPVDALDAALSRALEVFYPQVADIRLIDYKVRVLNSEKATAARVRVLITSTDGSEVWTTVGVSTDIIQASFEALTDAAEYKLLCL